MRSVARAALVLALAALAGCAAVDRYAADRLLDLTDVVDFKYGRAWGFGVKAELTLYLGTGVGLGVVESSREWYGRCATDFTLVRDGGPGVWLDGTFAHAGVIGTDGGSPGDAAQSAINTIFLNVLLLSADGEAPPLLSRWRVGAELLLPEATGGLYLNLGEAWDLLAGLAGADPAGDDGEPKRPP